MGFIINPLWMVMGILGLSGEIYSYSMFPSESVLIRRRL